MGCDLCNGNEVAKGSTNEANSMLIDVVGQLYIEIQTENSLVFVDELFDIRYCPMCGQRREVE